MTEEPAETPRRRRRSPRAASSGSAFLTVSSAEIVAQGATLARGIIVVRVIGSEQIGIAMTMLVFGELLKRMVNLNPGITLVQDRWGGSRSFRHTLQSVMVLRSIVYSSLIFLLAWPLSMLFGEENHVLGFMAVALLPLIGAFTHIDVYRQLRKRNYVPMALYTSIPRIISLCAAIALSFWIQTFWLPLIVRGIGNLTGVIVSRGVAKRRFGLALDRRHLMRILKFLIPLMGAGLIFWLNMTGPRALLASAPQLFDAVQFTMSDVGLWAIAMTLCNLPGAVGSRVISQTWSPRLARMRDDPERFSAIFREMQTVSYTLGAAVIVVLGAGSNWVQILYGEKVAAAGPIVTILSILGGMRLGRVAMRAAALSTGRSNIVFYSNLAAVSGMVAAVIAILTNASLEMIAYCMILGELGSLLIGNLMLARGPLALSVRDLWLRPILLCGAAILISFFERQVLLSMPLIAGGIFSLGLSLGLIGVMAIFNSNVRKFITNFK